MTSCDDDNLVALFRGLARRVAHSGQPRWPLPIFEAESYLYRYFLRRLLTLLEAALKSGMSVGEISFFFGTPTIVAEISYLLVGAQYSGLSLIEIRKLATILASMIREMRPSDPFCELGTNIDNMPRDWPSFNPEIQFADGDESRATIGHLTTALFSFAEFLQVGVPQYSREVRGPYPIISDGFMLVRDYFGLRLIEAWPFTYAFPYNRISITEKYTGDSNVVRFDLTNHLSSSEPLYPKMSKVSVWGYRTSWEKITDCSALVQTVVSGLSQGLQYSASFRREDWLHQHLQLRCLLLKPLSERLSLQWAPVVCEIEHLKELPLAYENLKPIIEGSYETIVSHLCNSCGVSGDHFEGVTRQ